MIPEYLLPNEIETPTETKTTQSTATQIIIVQDKRKGMTDSIFYDGEVAYIVMPDGTKYSLVATGDIQLFIGNEVYRNWNIEDAINEYGLTDEVLSRMVSNGKAVFEMNNWFEVIWMNPNRQCWDGEIGDIAHEYDSAIELLKRYMEQHEMNGCKR